MEQPFVLDCSVAMLWLHPDSNNAAAQRYADSVLTSFADGTQAYVPGLWHLEVANVCLMLEKGRHETFQRVMQFLHNVGKLPISVDPKTHLHVFDRVISVARQYELTAYNAAYLELAIRKNCPMATNDKKLKKAAQLTVGLLSV